MDLARGADAEELQRLAKDAEAEGARDALGRWVKGNPGRRKGSRNRLTNELAMSLLDDFHCYQDDNLKRLRRWFFPQYIQLMARFVPRETGSPRPDFASYAPAETALVAARVRAALDRVDAGGSGLDEVLAALEHDPGPGPGLAEAARALLEDMSKPVEYGESAETTPGGR
jgi:hypothetical protein